MIRNYPLIIGMLLKGANIGVERSFFHCLFIWPSFTYQVFFRTRIVLQMRWKLITGVCKRCGGGGGGVCVCVCVCRYALEGELSLSAQRALEYELQNPHGAWVLIDEWGITRKKFNESAWKIRITDDDIITLALEDQQRLVSPYVGFVP